MSDICKSKILFRVRSNISRYVGDVDVAAVPCGFGRAIGNKVWLCSPFCCFLMGLIILC